MAHAGGRPTEYREEMIQQVDDYLATCIDVEEDKENRISRKVRLPSIEGLALYLEVTKSSIYEWAEKHAEFSYVIDKLRHKQAEKLLNNGLGGSYNHTIAKVLLTKHGYREGIDNTTNEKDLPTPLLNGILNNNSDKEDSETE